MTAPTALVIFPAVTSFFQSYLRTWKMLFRQQVWDFCLLSETGSHTASDSLCYQGRPGSRSPYLYNDTTPDVLGLARVRQALHWLSHTGGPTCLVCKGIYTHVQEHSYDIRGQLSELSSLLLPWDLGMGLGLSGLCGKRFDRPTGGKLSLKP